MGATAAASTARGAHCFLPRATAMRCRFLLSSAEPRKTIPPEIPMTSARKHLTDAVRRTPLLVVPLALAALLLLAAAVVLLPFAAPLAIGYVILRRSAPADAPEATARSSAPALVAAPRPPSSPVLIGPPSCTSGTCRRMRPI